MTILNRIFTKIPAFAGMCLLLCAVSANAATLTVDTTSDSGVGSFRQALNDAITNGAANDIVFAIPTTDPNYSGIMNRFTITLASALPSIPVSATNITNTMMQDVTIMGNNTFRIFTLVDSAVVVMTNITMSNGGGGGLTANALGGAIYMGNSGTLTLNDCTIANSTASSNGGGIFMNDSGTIHVNRSTFTGNSGQSGGAIYVNTSGTVNLNNSTLSGNDAIGWDGGAISNSGTLNAVNNTFSGNFAAVDGGAIMNWATMTLTNNTIVQNQAQYGGGSFNSGAAATLNNNIVALNVASKSGADLFSGFTGTYNLIGVIDGSNGMETSPNIWGYDLTPLDPMIGPLQNNGGPTFTHALLTSSVAIDQGNSPAYLTDQRGYTRPVNDPLIANAGDGSDIGAFEKLGPSAANVSIGGRFMTSEGKGGMGISGVTVSIEDEAGNVRTAITNLLGFYEFPEVAAGMTYIATARHRQYQFETKAVSVFDQIADLDWTPITTTPSSNRTFKSELR